MSAYDERGTVVAMHPIQATSKTDQPERMNLQDKIAALKAEQPRRIVVYGPTGCGKTTVVFAIQTMLRERFGAVSMIEGDMSGTVEDKPADWEKDAVKGQGWYITEVNLRAQPEAVTNAVDVCKQVCDDNLLRFYISELKKTHTLVDDLVMTLKDCHPHISNDSIRARVGNMIIRAEKFKKVEE